MPVKDELKHRFSLTTYSPGRAASFTNGNDMEFSTILENVYQMWVTLITANGW
jgi:hypothetical protein